MTQTTDECYTFAQTYLEYWSIWNKVMCVEYETVDGGATCKVYDAKSSAEDGWPEEPRTCLVHDTAASGENFWTIVFTQESSSADPVASEILPNCQAHAEDEIIYVSTCDFTSAGWASNNDCWYDLTSYGIVLTFFGGFFALVVVIIVLVVL